MRVSAVGSLRRQGLGARWGGWLGRRLNLTGAEPTAMTGCLIVRPWSG